MELIRANPLSEKVVLAMGNHEYNNAAGAVERFESKTGQETNEVRYYRDDSGALTATVVKLGASNYGGNYTGSYDMLKTALETATAENAEAPVIVLGTTASATPPMSPMNGMATTGRGPTVIWWP